MRNTLVFLSLTVIAILAMTVLLPVIGAILLLAIVALVLAVGFFLAAPWLAKLPWFRDRIHVDDFAGRKIIRFGRKRYSDYRTAHDPFTGNPFAGHGHDQGRRLDDSDVIDVEGREVPGKD